jgi:uncharacterized cupin superfamily protein
LAGGSRLRIVNLRDLPGNERRSPKGRYYKFVKDISVALGRDPDSLDLRQRHPFDVALVRLPPGASYCPYHSHSCETEFYLVVSGWGTVRDPAGTTEVAEGDAFIFHPREPHQLSNRGSNDFVYYVIADNPVGDCCYYPDSQKWAVTTSEEELVIKGEPVSYYDGEE